VQGGRIVLVLFLHPHQETVLILIKLSSEAKEKAWSQLLQTNKEDPSGPVRPTIGNLNPEVTVNPIFRLLAGRIKPRPCAFVDGWSKFLASDDFLFLLQFFLFPA
jgi:hypothetical protein